MLFAQSFQKPNVYDILSGRGKPTQNHDGNQIFQQLIDRHRAAYQSAARNEKRAIAQQILAGFHAMGSRFLKPEEQESEGATTVIVRWIELSEKAALDKICHSLRRKNVTKKNNKKGEQVPLQQGVDLLHETAAEVPSAPSAPAAQYYQHRNYTYYQHAAAWTNSSANDDPRPDDDAGLAFADQQLVLLGSNDHSSSRWGYYDPSCYPQPPQ